MRNLTIKRIKSFVGCLAKMKVYIEDAVAGELDINGVPCRKLGDLKNGEEKTFVIEDNEARVYVIADKLSRGFCNEFYRIPEGADDVYLSGKNRFNLATGNAFRFDGVTDAEVLQNRKKGNKKGVIVLICALVFGLIIGFFGGKLMSNGFINREAEPKSFSAEGMSITLTDEFAENTVEGYTAFYEKQELAVLALKEDFSLIEGFEAYTLEDYGELVLEANQFGDDVKLATKDGVTYFTFDYENTAYNETYTYFSAIYKADDAFWMIQFMTFADDYEALLPEILEYAKSVKFE